MGKATKAQYAAAKAENAAYKAAKTPQAKAQVISNATKALGVNKGLNYTTPAAGSKITSQTTGGNVYFVGPNGKAGVTTKYNQMVEYGRQLNQQYLAGKLSAEDARNQFASVYAPDKVTTPTEETTEVTQPVQGESPAPSQSPADLAAAGGGQEADISGAATPSGTIGGAGTSGGGTQTTSSQQQGGTAGGGTVAFSTNDMVGIQNATQRMINQGMQPTDIRTQLATLYAGGDNSLFAQRYAASKAMDAATQDNINSIKPDTLPITRESNDSPYWNKFGNDAIAQEKVHAGYMNDRNQVIADYVTLSNGNIKYMTEAERMEAITKNIIDRQEGGVDGSMKDWYDNTINNINNLINRKVPELKADDYFQILLNGGDTTQVSNNNPYYQAGKRRYDKLNYYTSIGEAGIASAIQNGDLLPGSTEWNDLKDKGFGPVLTAAQGTLSTAIANNVNNTLLSSIYNFDPKTSLELQKTIPELFEGVEGKLSLAIINTMVSDQLPTFASFLLADNDVQNARTTAEQTASQINTLNQQVADLGDNLKEMYLEGGGESGNDAFLAAYAAEKAKPMIRQLDMLQTKYANEAATLERLTDNARTEFEVKEYNKTMKLQVYQMLLDMIQTKSANEAAAAQQQFENNIKLATLNKPVSLGRYDRLVDPVTGKVIATGGSSGGGGGGVSVGGTYANYAQFIEKMKDVGATTVSTTGKQTVIDTDTFLSEATKLPYTENNLKQLGNAIGIITHNGDNLTKDGKKLKERVRPTGAGSSTSTTDTNNVWDKITDAAGNVVEYVSEGGIKSLFQKLSDILGIND